MRIIPVTAAVSSSPSSPPRRHPRRRPGDDGRPPPRVRRLDRLNPQKNFITSAHPTAKDVYVNEIGAQAAQSRTFPFPEGSELVKESTDTETLTVFVITAMRKVAGFDPDNGDWQYGMFERARTAASAACGSRPAPTCTRCA
jgi:hypothetical protein